MTRAFRYLRSPADWNGRILPMGNVSIDFSNPTGAKLTSCWLPWTQNMRDLRRNLTINSNGAYVNTVNRNGSGYHYSAQLTGTNNSLATGAHALVGTNTQYDNPTNGTIACWFWIDTLPGGSTDNPGLINRSSAVNNNGLGMYIHYNSGAPKLLGFIRASPTTTDLNSPGFAGPTLRAGKWYHGCMVFRSGATSELYLDGVLLDSKSTVASVSMVGNGIYLGAHSQVGGVFFRSLTGRLGRCDWYRAALGKSEVVALSRDMMYGLRSGRTLFYAEGTVGPSEGIQSDLSFTNLFEREPFYDNTVTFGSSFGLDETNESISDTVTFANQFLVENQEAIPTTDTVTFTSQFIEDQEIRTEITFDDDVQFNVEEQYGSFEADILFKSQFESRSGELSNKRYRR